MARYQRLFFATAEDTCSVLLALESMQPFQYTLTGMFAEREPKTVRSFKDILDIGIAPERNAVSNPAYLMSLQGETVSTIEKPQRAGGTLFAINQRENPNTIVFAPGGRFSDDVLLYGSVGTVSTAQHSIVLFKIVSKLLRQKFTKVEEFLVGPEALEAWNRGTRLTIGASSPRDYDLGRRPPA